MNPDVMTLYRPVGMTELRLIFESGMKAYPPRLPGQPIFYPVLNLEYARQIAFNWNTREAPYAGYVTEFEIDAQYGNRFEHHIVGGRIHEELWVPAEDLDEFNRHIQGKIRVVDADFGPKFTGWIADYGRLRGKDAMAQLAELKVILSDNPNGFADEVSKNQVAIYLNYPFWKKRQPDSNSFFDEYSEPLDRLQVIRNP
jgi:hypothetical protein